MRYNVTDVKEFRSASKFTGLEIKHLIADNDLDDYTIRSVEKVYTPQNGLAYVQGHTYTITFERSN